jgi:Zn-dependent protease with chaperone function
MASAAIDQWLWTFPLDGWIRDHVAAVVENLPEGVRADLMDDPEFIVCDFDPGPQAVMHVPIRFSAGGKPGRSIVIKRSIKRRPVPFVRWVIAHELAHAYLRHGGRWPNEDPEQAADSLAAAWGFPKPDMW